MTTDRGPKRCTLRAGGVTLSAQAKGAGMIEPGFATMLCFVQTDAVVADPDAALRAAVAPLLRADHRRRPDEHQRHRAAAGDRRRPGAPLPEGLLDAVLLQLALEIVADGEGATRVGRVEVDEAASSAEEAERVARAIANSPLVKTALLRPRPQLGPDRPGRRDGARRRGARGARRRSIDAAELGERGAEAEIVACALGRGERAAHVCFSDLGYEYVRINAEYTT